MRIIETIKWLFNHPPVGITTEKNDFKCNYCGVESPTWTESNNSIEIYTICSYCRKKVFDKVLKPKK